MYQPRSAPTQEETTTPDADATLLEIDAELARQNAELAEAFEWPRERSDSALPLDGELLEQIAELDRFAAQACAASSPSVPEHSRRC